MMASTLFMVSSSFKLNILSSKVVGSGFSVSGPVSGPSPCNIISANFCTHCVFLGAIGSEIMLSFSRLLSKYDALKLK